LKKDLDRIEDKQDRLEAQIASEKRRIAGEIARLNKEVKQLESSLAKKEKQIDGKKSSIRNTVARLKSLYDVENTQVVIYNDENEKYDGYAEKLSFAARALDVASIVSPVSFFDICSAYTGKDCVKV
jgi:seryl-tRNA synthetase